MRVTGKGLRAAQAFVGAALSDCVWPRVFVEKGTSEVCLDSQLRHPNQGILTGLRTCLGL